MLRVYSCIAQERSPLLLAVAVVICLCATLTALMAFQNAVQEVSRRRRRIQFILVASLLSGLGIWATHFVAMLAYEPGIPVSYDIPKTLLSMLVAVAICAIGWSVAQAQRRFMAPLGGAVIGAGIGAMHYLGMSAIQIAGDIVWDRDFVAVSLVLGICFASGAVWLHRRAPKDPAWWPASLLALAICGTHFTGMTAATIYPHQARDVAAQSIDSPTLAIVVTIVTIIMALGSGLIMFDRRLAANQLAQARGRAELAEEILRGAQERERLAAELRYQAEISAAALDNMAQGLTMFDADDRLVAYNRRYVELYGIPEEMMERGVKFDEMARRLIDFFGVPSNSEQAEIPSVENPDWTGEHELQLPNGQIVKYYRRSLPNGGWVATHEDVTDARRSNQQIAYLAAHDTLTGLPNRATFSKHLNSFVKACEPFAVHVIDLDRFKEVNDTLGHPIGDEILRGTAMRLRELTTQTDVLTRLGGDEFAVIRSDIGKTDAPATLARRIVERLCEPFEFEGHTIVIGASVGISLAPKQGTDGEELLKMSDLALYNAKGGKPGYLSLLRGRHGFAPVRPPSTGSGSPRGDRRRAIRSPLSTGPRHGQGRDYQFRSARALASSDTRPGCARRVHRDSGRQRPDHSDR